MTPFANLYPGHLTVEFFVIAAVAVALVSATAWIASLFLERRPAVRHGVLLSALVACLAIPLLAFAFVASRTSLIALPLLAPAASPTPEPQPRNVGIAGNDLPRWQGPVTDLPESGPIPAVVESFPGHPGAAQGALADPNSGVTKTDPVRSTVVAVLLLWLGGTVVSLVGLVRSGLFLYRLRRSIQPVSDVEMNGALGDARRLVGAHTSLSVSVSPLARTPMAAGLFRPVIVLPVGLLDAISSEQLRDVLMHEIAHIERRDNLLVLLQAIATAVFWPIPFVHLLNRQLARAREDICDNHVLACRDAVSYGETLLRVAQLACGAAMPVGTVGMLHWRGKLEERVYGLIHKRRSKMTRTHPLIALSVLALFLSGGAVLCGTTIVAAPTDERKSVTRDEKESKGEAKKLLQDLKDQDGEVRKAVIEALKQFDKDRALAPLLKALKDDDARVRQAAIEALKKPKEKKGPAKEGKNDQEQPEQKPAEELARAKAASLLNELKRQLGEFRAVWRMAQNGGGTLWWEKTGFFVDTGSFFRKRCDSKDWYVTDD